MPELQMVVFRVPVDLLAEFDAIVRRLGMSRSEALRQAMKMFVSAARAPRVRKLYAMGKGSRIRAERLDELFSPA